MLHFVMVIECPGENYSWNHRGEMLYLMSKFEVMDCLVSILDG
jgi:hypothetical protein